MRLSKLAAIACTCALFAAACATQTTTNQTATTNTNTPAAATPAATPVDQLADARKLYGQTCARCHGDTGEGGVVDLEGKKLKVPSLRTGHVLKHDDQGLAGKIADGGDGMPAFKKRLDGRQIDSLVRFIRHDFQAGATGPTGATGTTNDNHAANTH